MIIICQVDDAVVTRDFFQRRRSKVSEADSFSCRLICVKISVIFRLLILTEKDDDIFQDSPTLLKDFPRFLSFSEQSHSQDHFA